MTHGYLFKNMTASVATTIIFDDIVSEEISNEIFNMFMSEINIEKFDSYIWKKLDDPNSEDAKLKKKIFAIYSP